MQEQARREQARREAIAQRRAYEAYMRKEAARRRAAEEEAAAAEYRQAVMNKILKAYAAQAHAQHQEEEEDDDEQVQLRQQTRIPISSFASDRGSEDEVEQDEASEHGDYEAEEEEELTQESQNMKDEFARDSTPNQPKISYEEAVAIVQKHAQVALLVRRRLASLNKIRENFLSQQRSFRPPKTWA